MLADLWDRLSVTASITSNPSGVEVFIKDWQHLEDRWVSIGRTPFRETTLLGGPVRFQFRKEGNVPLETVTQLEEKKKYHSHLRQEGETPQHMVHVSGVWNSPFRRKDVPSGPFLIDKYEVRNRDFQQFIDVDGYENRDYWTQEFVKDGEHLFWEDALNEFRDRTGHPGPATWSDGGYPDGEADFPVRGVSWYEAAAYAEFVGKSLPSVHYWMAAARRHETHWIVTLSNFEGTGPVSTLRNAKQSFEKVRSQAGTWERANRSQLSRTIRALS